MKYLYSWLKEHVTALPPIHDLVPLLVQLGHDVESVQPLDYAGVFVAEIKHIQPHPNADKLSLVSVWDGTTTHEVVCGAPNCAVGQKVPYAAIGTQLPCGITLKAAKIRGSASDGMLCAEDELGLGPSHEGLLLLPYSAEVGRPLSNYVTPDAIITIDVTPNRGDVLSHFGLARDIQAALEQPLLQPHFLRPEYVSETTQASIGQLHPDAEAFSLGQVTITSNRTPLLMQSRLHLLGMRAINLPTDITNYLLLEYGQPLHAYDLDRLGDPPLFGVRRAHEGEQFIGLNGQTYRLTPQSLLITANDHPVGLAGILGGEETKTLSTTSQVIIESAHFYSKSISVMVRGLQLFTDGALRWDRGVDPELSQAVLAHAQALLAQLGGGKAYQPIHQTNKISHGPVTTRVKLDHIQRIIGLPLDLVRTTTLLHGLGCEIEAQGENLAVTSPSWRYDLAIAEDYIEELARLIGFQNLPKSPLPASVPQWKRSPYWREEHFKDTLTQLDAYEIVTYPFVDEIDAPQESNETSRLELTSPPLGEKRFLRHSLIPGMLEAIAINPETPFMVLFEIAALYGKEETRTLCLSVSGGNQVAVDTWWQNFFERLRLPVSSWMGRVKTIDETVKSRFKIRKGVVTVLELPIADFPLGKTAEILPVSIPDLDAIHYSSLSKFQTSRRDIAFIADTTYNGDVIATELARLDPAIVAVELFDTYRDTAKLGENKQSLAYHIFFQSPERTLTTEEIETIQHRLTTYIQEHYHGILR